MLELRLGSRAPGGARKWLDHHPSHAIPGLIPMAAARGKLADAALDYLRAQSGKGRAGFIREYLAAAPPETVEKLRREVLERADQAIPSLDDDTTPDWLRTASPGRSRSGRRAGWTRPAPADPRGG